MSRPAWLNPTGLEDALDGNELFLDYQPIVSLGSRRIDCLEALIRWQHPRLGRLGPDRFLDLADPPMERRLTMWVLRTATANCATWQAAGLRAAVAINASPAVLLDDLVPDAAAELLAQRRLVPDSLVVELTERRSDVGIDQIRGALSRLGAVGVRISLDDFGTSESTLSRLQQFRFDQIKIDGSFVCHMAQRGRDRAIIAYSTELGHTLGTKVVAEGVEHPNLLSRLAQLGVDSAQGYGIGRPAPWPLWLMREDDDSAPKATHNLQRFLRLAGRTTAAACARRRTAGLAPR